MDFKLMMTTFGLVFLAELGDKTQFATFCLSAEKGSKISVFLGSACALVITSLLAVLFGAAFSQFIPHNYIKAGTGVFFIIAGIWFLISPIRSI